tara:strand:+ start:364 stop:1017 length:654 start_codon:yes stop_codon:yes gene_type:complete
MPEVIISGPEGRIEAKYTPCENPQAPLALILHPEPNKGGTMNNKVIFSLYREFVKRNFATMRFNFRGVGRSQGSYDDGEGELADAATAMDWLQSQNPNASYCWVAGFSFGAWIGMQLMMRRPEIKGFISLSAPTLTRDFSFLAPCPSSGLFIHGSENETVPIYSLSRVLEKISIQKGAVIEDKIISGADHFFNDHHEEMINVVREYLDKVFIENSNN